MMSVPLNASISHPVPVTGTVVPVQARARLQPHPFGGSREAANNYCSLKRFFGDVGKATGSYFSTREPIAPFHPVRLGYNVRNHPLRE